MYRGGMMMVVMMMWLVRMVTVSAAHFDPRRRTSKFMILRMLGFCIHRKRSERYPCLRHAEHESKELVRNPYLQDDCDNAPKP